jgi:Domain of unknown function (DUF6457)
MEVRMSEWIDELATTLGLDPLDKEEANLLLDAARDVAHRVERRITPLSTFLLGMAVAGRLAANEPRNDALNGIVEAMRETLPAAPES